ncbi:hypothetical protein GCM10007385_09450 [Tateyamaria omphalii]|nr:hypothetical protein GCM10007385_09450 [Tateyamaria omphalii]
MENAPNTLRVTCSLGRFVRNPLGNSPSHIMYRQIGISAIEDRQNMICPMGTVSAAP